MEVSYGDFSPILKKPATIIYVAVEIDERSNRVGWLGCSGPLANRKCVLD